MWSQWRAAVNGDALRLRPGGAARAPSRPRPIGLPILPGLVVSSIAPGWNVLDPSMGHTACCHDNAPMENFFHTPKLKLLHQRRWATRDEARREPFVYIEGDCNRLPIHSALGYSTPEQAERKASESPVPRTRGRSLAGALTVTNAMGIRGNRSHLDLDGCWLPSNYVTQAAAGPLPAIARSRGMASVWLPFVSGAKETASFAASSNLARSIPVSTPMRSNM